MEVKGNLSASEDREFSERLYRDYLFLQKVLDALGYINLKKLGEGGKYLLEKIPRPKLKSGYAYTVAYPIQGILKYHGLADYNRRIAFFPSISITNTSVFTLTYVDISPELSETTVVLNGKRLKSDDPAYRRILHQIRSIGGIIGYKFHARIVSANLVSKDADLMGHLSQNRSRGGDNSDSIDTDDHFHGYRLAAGKGLGTSASAGAAIAEAVVNILYGEDHPLSRDVLFKSILARFMAGSASRSAAGGLALWLSHPKASDGESFAVRLDCNPDSPMHSESFEHSLKGISGGGYLSDERGLSQIFRNDLKKIIDRLESMQSDRNRPSFRKVPSSFTDKLVLYTIPISLDIKTDRAHELAPLSPFFKEWAFSRREKVMECLGGIIAGDVNTIGRMAEYDTYLLHAVTQSASDKNPLFLWKPLTVGLMNLTREMRESGLTAYFSIDTGPSVIILTDVSHSSRVERILTDYLEKWNDTIIRQWTREGFNTNNFHGGLLGDGPFSLLKGHLGKGSHIVTDNASLTAVLDNDIKKLN